MNKMSISNIESEMQCNTKDFTLQGKKKKTPPQKVLLFKLYISFCWPHLHISVLITLEKKLISYDTVQIVFNATTYILSILVSTNHLPADEKTVFYKFLNVPPLG